MHGALFERAAAYETTVADMDRNPDFVSMRVGYILTNVQRASLERAAAPAAQAATRARC